jgi:hypothetical protein
LKPTLGQRLRYAFDNTMSRGAWALVAWLALACGVLIAIFSAVVLLGDLAPKTDGGRPGLMLAQISENAHLSAVFVEPFGTEGSEIYLRPAGDYVRTGAPVTFATLVELARRRGEVAIGYRIGEHADDPERAYGVRVNPPKSASVTLDGGDRVIVLAEE